MGINIDFDDGQTPLDEDEKEGLKIPGITTRGSFALFSLGAVCFLDDFVSMNKVSSL